MDEPERIQLDLLASHLEHALARIDAGSQTIPRIGWLFLHAEDVHRAALEASESENLSPEYERLGNVLRRWSLLHSAVHEAGHAAVASIVGLVINGVSASARFTDIVPRTEQPLEQLRIAVTCFAGPAAETAFEMFSPRGVKSDFETAHNHLIKCGLFASAMTVFSQCVAIATSETAAIERLAIGLFFATRPFSSLTVATYLDGAAKGELREKFVDGLAKQLP